MTIPSSPTIPLAPHAAHVIQRLESHSYEAYAVGGCVRDSLMGKTPLDWDVCTNATPEQVLAVFSDHHTIKTGLQHGTVTVMVKRAPIEVTTYRLDGAYSDQRRPDSVTYVSDLREDLARRDFTINAMAYNPQQGLVDCFNGREDLEKKIIRCVGVARERFEEDGLRILRALRFASRLGFDIEQQTSRALRQQQDLLTAVSVERIFKELKGILVGQGAAGILISYAEVFGSFLPELAPMQGLDQQNPHHLYDVWDHCAHTVQAIEPDETLRLTALLHDSGKPACFSIGEDGKGHFIGHEQLSDELAEKLLRRLKSDTATIKTVCKLIRHHGEDFPSRRAGMRRWVGEFGIEGLDQLLELKRADIMAQSPMSRNEKLAKLDAARALRDEVLEEEACFTLKDLSLGGADLLAMGMKPSPAMRELLQQLLREVQDESLENTREALATRAQELRASEAL